MARIVVSEGSSSAGGTQSCSNAEDHGGGHRDQGQQDGRPSNEGSRGTGYQGCYGGVNSVNEAEATAHEIARQDESDCTRGQSDEKL